MEIWADGKAESVCPDLSDRCPKLGVTTLIFCKNTGETDAVLIISKWSQNTAVLCVILTIA